MLEQIADALGRNDGPAMLLDLHFVDRTLDLNRPDMSGAVADVWCGAEYPLRACDVETWCALYQISGYSHDGELADRPIAAVTLYRGCEHAGRFGMSWTADIEIARQFAYEGLRGRNKGRVYEAIVEPRYLLAYIGKPRGRDESEYVVDPAGLNDGNVKLLEAGDS